MPKKPTPELWRARCRSAEEYPPHLRVHRTAPWMARTLGCGWRGPWRKRNATAVEDADEHQKLHPTKPPYVSTEGCCWPHRHPRKDCKQLIADVIAVPVKDAEKGDEPVNGT